MRSLISLSSVLLLAQWVQAAPVSTNELGQLLGPLNSVLNSVVPVSLRDLLLCAPRSYICEACHSYRPSIKLLVKLQTSKSRTLARCSRPSPRVNSNPQMAFRSIHSHDCCKDVFRPTLMFRVAAYQPSAVLAEYPVPLLLRLSP